MLGPLRPGKFADGLEVARPPPGRARPGNAGRLPGRSNAVSESPFSANQPLWGVHPPTSRRGVARPPGKIDDPLRPGPWRCNFRRSRVGACADSALAAMPRPRTGQRMAVPTSARDRDVPFDAVRAEGLGRWREIVGEPKPSALGRAISPGGRVAGRGKDKNNPDRSSVGGNGPWILRKYAFHSVPSERGPKLRIGRYP